MTQILTLQIANIRLADIRRDSGAQFRAPLLKGGVEGKPWLNEQHVTEIAEGIERGDSIPMIIVFGDGSDYWLGDGDHRIEAHERLGHDTISAEVRQGTQLDARRFGRQANREHKGLKRSPKTKRAQVTDALRDPDWADWSNHAIAKYCDVSESLVRQVASDPSLTTIKRSDTRTFTDKYGNVSTMNIGSIGSHMNASQDNKSPMDVDCAMPFPMDAAMEYTGVHSENFFPFVTLFPDYGGWSIQIDNGSSISVTKHPVREDILGLQLQTLAKVNATQVVEMRWHTTPADRPDTIHFAYRRTINQAAQIGRQLAEINATSSGAQFEDRVISEFNGTREGAEKLMAFVRRLDRAEGLDSTAILFYKALDALRAFGIRDEEDEEPQQLAA